MSEIYSIILFLQNSDRLLILTITVITLNVFLDKWFPHFCIIFLSTTKVCSEQQQLQQQQWEQQHIAKNKKKRHMSNVFARETHVRDVSNIRNLKVKVNYQFILQ